MNDRINDKMNDRINISEGMYHRRNTTQIQYITNKSHTITDNKTQNEYEYKCIECIKCIK